MFDNPPPLPPLRTPCNSRPRAEREQRFHRERKKDVVFTTEHGLPHAGLGSTNDWRRDCGLVSRHQPRVRLQGATVVAGNRSTPSYWSVFLSNENFDWGKKKKWTGAALPGHSDAFFGRGTFCVMGVTTVYVALAYFDNWW